MKEIHLFYAPDIETTSSLPAEEAGHAVRVLRMKEGDHLLATDGCGAFYACTVTIATAKRCDLRIDRREQARRLWQGGIHLAVAPTKNMDRMEWLAEKATEIGVDTLSFIDCKNSERHVVKPERVERIVVSAMKQSHKAIKPKVEPMLPFECFIARPFNGQSFIAHCHDMADVMAAGDGQTAEAAASSRFLADVVHPEGDTRVLIGPEGDFSIDEVRAAISQGFIPISLGESRLRTETAALVAVHIMNMCKRVAVAAQQQDNISKE